MNSRRVPFVAAAGLIAAGAVYVWRSFVARRFRFPRGNATAEWPCPKQPSTETMAPKAPNDAGAQQIMKFNNIIGAIVAVKRPVPHHRHRHHLGHHHGTKHSAIVRNVIRHHGELGLNACLEKAVDRAVRSGAAASCRKQQAAALKMGLAQNQLNKACKAKKMPKSFAH